MVFVGSVQVILIVAVVALLDAFLTLVFRQIKRQFSRWKCIPVDITEIRSAKSV